MIIKPAVRTQRKLRVAIIGPSGAGKTKSALELAKEWGKKILVIDTEHGSASIYADDKTQFDTIELTSFHPQFYINAIKLGKDYDVLVIDSLSHAWMGKDGALEQVDRAAAASKSGNSFAAWRTVTPLHNQLVETMLSFPGHLIVTMRAKTEYSMETNEKGKVVPVKVGLGAIQKDGLEYEFDIVGDITLKHDFVINKTRCEELADTVWSKPGKELGQRLKSWADSGSLVPKETSLAEVL